jgi:hypothetical protein
MRRRTAGAGGSSGRNPTKHSSTGRRAAIRRLMLGGTVAAAAPGTWTRPVVETIVLPAHAQTSPGHTLDGDFFPEPGGDGPPEIVPLDARRGSAKSSRLAWLDWLMPGAYAGSSPPEIPELPCSPCGLCARIEDETVTLTILRIESETLSEICYEASGKIGQTVHFSLVSGLPVYCSTPGSIQIVRIEDEAPGRTLVLGDGTSELNLVEDPSRQCSCGELACIG